MIGEHETENRTGPVAARRCDETRGAVARVEAADRRMADAEALLEVAGAQLSIAARHSANAAAAEREYRQAAWRCAQVLEERLLTPLETIIALTDAVLDEPAAGADRQRAMVEAIRQHARTLHKICQSTRIEAGSDERVPARPPARRVTRFHQSGR